MHLDGSASSQLYLQQEIWAQESNLLDDFSTGNLGPGELTRPGYFSCREPVLLKEHPAVIDADRCDNASYTQQGEEQHPADIA